MSVRLTREELLTAWERVRANHGCPGADGVSIEAFQSDLSAELEAVCGALERGDYAPYALLEIVLDKPTGGPRVLAVPTVRDRVVQAAVHERVVETFESEFEYCSFGYRRGRSVREAVRRVRDLRDAGYQWVVDADIDGCFDRLDHAHLLGRLGRMKFDHEIQVLLGMWVTGPRWDGRGLWVPRTGIPQGAVVSPALANLALDTLDEHLEDRGLRIVRYADDFLILCRSPAEASAALELTDRVLEAINLSLDVDKTAVTDFDRGFRFLGAIFVRSLIMQLMNLDHRRQSTGVALPTRLAASRWRRWLEANLRSWREYVEDRLSREERSWHSSM